MVGDCVIRAISKVTNQDWDTTFLAVMLKAFELKDIPSSNALWASYLHDNGFKRTTIPDTCPECYTVKDFTADNPEGTFLLATGTHVVAVVDGDYYDTWDSGDETPIYFFSRKES